MKKIHVLTGVLVGVRDLAELRALGQTIVKFNRI